MFLGFENFNDLEGQIKYLNFYITRLAKKPEDIEEVKLEIKRLEDHRQYLLDLANCFTGMEKKVFVMKYFNDMKLEDIAVKVHSTHSHIKNVNIRVTKILSFIKKYESMR